VLPSSLISSELAKQAIPVVRIVVHDMEFEPEHAAGKDKNEVGYYMHRNMKFVDTTSYEDPHVVRVPLRNAKPQECVRIVVQNIHDEEFYGSISINVGNYLLCP
jgi:hypothetical protein